VSSSTANPYSTSNLPVWLLTELNADLAEKGPETAQ
jgi:hypothetical protein